MLGENCGAAPSNDATFAAVAICGRVDGVDSVWRDGEGWRVDGRMDDGRDFSCSLDGDGRIRKLTVGGQAA